MKKSTEKTIWGIIGLVGIDQASKLWALSALSESSQSVLPFFNLHLTFNTGVAFSMPIPKMAIIILTTFFLGGVVWWLFRKTSSLLEQIGLVMVLAGGIGNLLDRILRGEVIDFLSFWSFPVFNVADICITIGVCFLFWSQIKQTSNSKMTNYK